MNTILRIAMLLVGGSLAAWLALVAHDLGNGFARFARFASRRTERPSPRGAERPVRSSQAV